ncbi:MAG: rod shape-determining protein MreD [Peptococcaceae bacterium]|jgi:rod shape-determining protein MreD|nr:rod shape-determining protein MreD [Peptococcaceae bacterium]
MRAGWFLVLIVAASLLSSTVFTFLQVMGVKPDLALVLIILYGFSSEPREGAVWGLFGGLLQDLLSGGYLGLHALEGMAAGYLAAMAGTRFFRENTGVLAISTFGVSFAAGVVHFVLLLFLNIHVNAQVVFLRLIPISSAYNTLAALLVSRLTARYPESLSARRPRF